MTCDATETDHIAYTHFGSMLFCAFRYNSLVNVVTATVDALKQNNIILERLSALSFQNGQ